MTAEPWLGIAALVALGVLAPGVYRRGRRCCAPLLPDSVVEELRAHKLGCLGEPDERVALEITLLVGGRNALSGQGRAARRG